MKGGKKKGFIPLSEKSGEITHTNTCAHAHLQSLDAVCIISTLIIYKL